MFSYCEILKLMPAWRFFIKTLIHFLVILLFSLPLYAGESSSNRKGKTIQMTMHFGGEYSGLASGASGAYFIDSQSLIGLGVSYFSEINIFSDSLEGTGIELYYQKFLGNSFFLKPTVSYRNANSHNFLDKILGDDKTGKLIDLSLGLKIGNQWQWDHFTFGIDLVGASFVVSKLKRSENISRPKDYHITLLNFSLGASF